MTSIQKIIKYFALAFAMALIVSIVSIIATGVYEVSSNLGFVATDNTKISSEMKTVFNNSSNVDTLNIDINSTNIELRRSEEFKIETNNNKINVYNNNSDIEIKENGFKTKFKNDYKLIVYIPNYIKKINLETGFGKVIINNLGVENISLDMGAGKLTINDLVVTNGLSINGGAGSLKMINSKINNLDLELGAGKAYIDASLYGDNKIECGLGDLELILENDNHKIKVDKGIGNILYNGSKISEGIIGNGNEYIEIDGGIGKISIEQK